MSHVLIIEAVNKFGFESKNTANINIRFFFHLKIRIRQILKSQNPEINHKK